VPKKFASGYGLFLECYVIPGREGIGVAYDNPDLLSGFFVLILPAQYENWSCHLQI